MAAYGADEFPAFFTRRSGCAAPARIDSPQPAAAMIRHSARLGLGSGAVIGEGPFPHPKRRQNPPMSWQICYCPSCMQPAGVPVSEYSVAAEPE